MNFWLENNKNVLLFGPHGVGKSSIIKEGFENYGLVLNKTYLMFSGATLDPWTDFIGIPKKASDDDGNDYLEYVKPKYMNYDLQAIFMDEYNRTSKPVRNALMELIQFKSINGTAFPNLKVIWAACNPESGDYDTEILDPAQGDRFHIILNIPKEPSKTYFTKKYGYSIGNQALSWWNSLPDTTKDVISPRRLDYVIEYHKAGGDIIEMLPIDSNVSELKRLLGTDPIISSLEKALDDKDWIMVSEILNSEEHYEDLKLKVFNNPKFFSSISNYLGDEKLNNLLITNDDYFDWATGKIHVHNRLFSAFKELKLAFDSDSYNKNTNKEQIINTILNAGRRDNNNLFLCFNPTAPKIFGTAKNNKPDLSIFKSKLSLYLNEMYSNRKKGYKSVWDRLLLVIPNPKVFDKDACHLFLSMAKDIVNFKCKNNLKGDLGEVFPELIPLLNLTIIRCHDMGFFTGDYFDLMLNDILIKSKGDTKNVFIIEEKETIEVGDLLLNMSGKELSNSDKIQSSI